MKKFSIFLPVIFLASFFFVSYVNADTYNLEINSSYFDYLESQAFSDLIEFNENLISENHCPAYSDFYYSDHRILYFIWYSNNQLISTYQEEYY